MNQINAIIQQIKNKIVKKKMIGYMYSCLWTPILGDWTISTPIICLMVDVALFFICNFLSS